MRLLSDYRGPYFDHREARLKQLDIRDEEKKLIAPWKLYDALKPGTMILADISLHCYIYPKKNQNEDGRKVNGTHILVNSPLLNIFFEIYQITAHKIQIFDKQSNNNSSHFCPPLEQTTMTTARPGIRKTYSRRLIPKKKRMDTD